MPRNEKLCKEIVAGNCISSFDARAQMNSFVKKNIIIKKTK